MNSAIVTHVDLSTRGRWISVPALRWGETNLVLKGRWLKVATVHDENWIEGELTDVDGCVRALQRTRFSGARADILTFAQRLPALEPRFSYLAESESVAAVSLPSYDTWWKGLPQGTRKNVRRAAKRGVRISLEPLSDKLVHDIVEVNNDSPTRQGIPFHHYGKTAEQVRRDQSTHLDHSEFICAYDRDELIGFLKMVYCPAFGTLLQLLTKSCRQEARPANALLARAVQRCDERGLSYLVYGKYRYGNQPDTSLMEFKERNGFREFFVPRYYIPLTAKGKLALRGGFHRDTASLLPVWATGLGRRLRAQWHRVQGRRSAYFGQ